MDVRFITKRLVDNARDFWKWLSMWAMGLAAAIQGAYDSLPQSMKDALPSLAKMTVILLVLGIVGRMVKQTPKDDGPKDIVVLPKVDPAIPGTLPPIDQSSTARGRTGEGY